MVDLKIPMYVDVTKESLKSPEKKGMELIGTPANKCDNKINRELSEKLIERKILFFRILNARKITLSSFNSSCLYTS